MHKVFLRTGHNYDRKAASLASAYRSDKPSLAVQSQKEDADINTIVKRFGITGVVPASVRVPTYGDFGNVFDFQSAMNAVVEAERAFMEMPADVRRRFGNDPNEFVKFCSDKENLPELRKMGLAIPEPEPEAPIPPVKVEIVGGEVAK